MGTNKGLGKAITGTVNAIPAPKIVYTTATPDEILTGETASGLAFDSTNSELYMVEAAGGSEWIHLGSVS